MADRNQVAQALLSNYTPSWREQIGNSIYDVAKALGMGTTANRMRNEAVSVVDFVPGAGEAVGLNDAYNDFQAGNYGLAAAGIGATAAGIIPGIGDASAATLRKFLPSSSSLNLPRIPTMNEVSELGEMMEVPVASLRGSQSKMDWDSYRKGSYGEPLFGDFSMSPVGAKKRDGEVIVYDGHHRAVDAINEGRDTIKMWVIDAGRYDPSAAGRAQQGYEIGDDDILRELGL